MHNEVLLLVNQLLQKKSKEEVKQQITKIQSINNSIDEENSKLSEKQPKKAKIEVDCALIIASGLEGFEDIVEQLLKVGANINVLFKSSSVDSLPLERTPLMVAAINGRLPTVMLLIKNGAKIDAVSSRVGSTALMYAAAKNQLDVVQYLVEKGANVELRSRFLDDGVSSYHNALDRANVNGAYAVVRYLESLSLVPASSLGYFSKSQPSTASENVNVNAATLN